MLRRSHLDGGSSKRRRRPQAASLVGIDQTLSPVIMRHRDAGYPFDRKHRGTRALTWKGISSTKAKLGTMRQARPLLADDLQALLGTLRAVWSDLAAVLPEYDAPISFQQRERNALHDIVEDWARDFVSRGRSLARLAELALTATETKRDVGPVSHRLPGVR
jgi:hypothetical protein